MTSHNNRAAPLRLRRKVKHVLTAMLCCGKRKDEEGGGGGGGGVSMAPARGIVVQRDFRKVSGISNEVFRQLEAVEREAAPLLHCEGGEMLLRLFDPCALGRVGAESYRQYLGAADAQHLVRFVEIVKRPGQTLGLYIREGDGLRETEGVFISRIALESAVYNSGLLRVGDEILAVNLVDVRRMSLDDVVIVMSIPRRLVLTIRSRVCSGGQRVRQLTAAHERRPRAPPVVVLKQDTTEEGSNGENGENGHLIRARTKGLPPEIPAIAVKLSERDHQRERHRYETPPTDEFRFQPQHHRPSTLPHHHHPYHQAPPRWAHHRRTRSAVLSPRHGSSATAAPPQRQTPAAAAEGILRRGGGGSASDTEADSSLWTHHQMGGGRRQRYGGRSHSLPRGYGGGGGGGRHGVRFTTNHHLPYGDSSQEESDGAVSAPELPATRRPNSMRRRPSVAPPRRVFTSNEYRAWMRRAPSTSAIYDRLRTPHPLPRVAYSAESLLDTVRQDGGGIYTFPRRLQMPGGGSSLPHPAEEEDRLLRLVSLDPRDFNKYHRSVSGGGGGGGESGLLWVHLLSGRGLMGGRGGGGGFRDLYCVLECDRVHKARTVIRTGDHSFDWDEIFEIDLVDNREVAFLLYSWDPRFRHKLCYKGTLHLGALLRESPVHSLALKLEPRGTLYLKLRHKDPLHAFQRTPAHQALFGADLEAVLVREDSGFGVPLIVKRCTEEVERRGLEIVGIYRLCGSALRKRLLRDEFERSASHANLSVEHVPDINVVTSVLKDYLRELPEPLLSRSLYDMLVDGLSVCLPEDPQGSANLIFSILECLPKANLCTVLLLLDHLRLIASHCDRNRMGCEGLAAAFGPALACAAPHHIDIAQPIDITARLLRMWPDKRTSWSSSGGSWDSGALSELLESLLESSCWRH